MLLSRLPKSSPIKYNVRFLSEKANHTNFIVDRFNRDLRNGGIVPPFKLAALFEDKYAIHDHYGEVTYRGLFEGAKGLSHTIKTKLHGQQQKTIAYMCPGDISHIITLWAIWMSGNIAVPLSPLHPYTLIDYFLKDCGASAIICEPTLCSKIPKVDVPIVQIPPTIRTHALLDSLSQEHAGHTRNHIHFGEFPNADFYAESDALILYTSGTTSSPKGVVHGFKQIAHQIASLHNSWRYRADDTLLHCLPLNHIHGLIASVCAGLAAGAKIRMMSYFSPAAVWAHLLGMKKRDSSRITVFMGVPTMYAKLIEEYEKVFVNSRHKEYVRSVLGNRMRLMISGSAPLPNAVFERWEDITGHRLLERYGMTETGLALTNPYEPVSDRTPGYVGTPLPGVSAKIGDSIILDAPPADLQVNLSQLHFDPDIETPKNLFVQKETVGPFDNTCKVTYLKENNPKETIQGELFIRGPTVMNCYWGNPEHTKSEFTEDGWFKTGDSAVYEDGKMKIFGRTSVDIIKSGGYKISALEVEAVLFGHPFVADAVVLGLPDLVWGEKVAAVLELKEGATVSLEDIQEFGSDYMPKYQLPTALYIIPRMPRNTLGKVNKVELRETLLKQVKK